MFEPKFIVIGNGLNFIFFGILFLFRKYGRQQFHWCLESFWFQFPHDLCNCKYRSGSWRWLADWNDSYRQRLSHDSPLYQTASPVGTSKVSYYQPVFAVFEVNEKIFHNLFSQAFKASKNKVIHKLEVWIACEIQLNSEIMRFNRGYDLLTFAPLIWKVVKVRVHKVTDASCWCLIFFSDNFLEVLLI